MVSILSSGLVAAHVPSTEPKPLWYVQPIFAQTAFTSSGVLGAPPTLIFFREDRSYLFNPSMLTTFVMIAGTEGRAVTFSCWIAWQTRSGSVESRSTSLA